LGESVARFTGICAHRLRIVMLACVMLDIFCASHLGEARAPVVEIA
jgi:hypothetical protein